jgi:hypothetical protein
MQSHTLNKNEYLHEKSYTLYSAIPLPPCGVTAFLWSTLHSATCILGEHKRWLLWSCWWHWETSSSIYLCNNCIDLEGHMKTFSKSLVISFGMKPTGFPAIDVSTDFLMRRWATRPKRTNSVSPVSSPARIESLYLFVGWERVSKVSKAQWK